MYVMFSFLFMVLLAPTSSFAAWDDKSDELPGMEDNSKIITIVVVGAVIIVGLLIYHAKKKNAEKKEEAVIQPVDEVIISSAVSSDEFLTFDGFTPVVATIDSL